MLLITFLIWVAYSIFEGFREGYYWHYKNIGDDGNNYEIHPIFSAQRGMVLVSISMTSFLIFNYLLSLGLLISLIKAVSFVVCLMLIFSFLHNGVYYTTRNLLNNKIYTKKWIDHSKTSTAKWTKFLTFPVRATMFGLGLVGILLIILL